MKKLIAVLCCLMAFVLSSCTETPTYSTKYSAATNTPIPASTQIPANFTKFSLHALKTFIDMAGTQGIEYYMPKDALMDRADNEGSPFYSFDIHGNNSTSGSVWIFEKSESIRIWFLGDMLNNNKVDPKMVKSSINATLKALDENIDTNKIDSLISSLVSSFDGKSYSSIITYKDYSLFIEPYVGGLNFYALKTDRYLNDGKDRSGYKMGNASSLSAPLNTDERYYIDGTVIDLDYSGTYGFATELVDILTSENESVSLIYSLDTLPIVLVTGEKYKFYGTVRMISGTSPILWVDHIIPNK